MQNRVALSGLIDAAAGVAGAAFIALVMHLAWMGALIGFFGMIVLICVFAGIASNASLAVRVLNLLGLTIVIDLAVCMPVFAGAMLWGVVFSAWKDMKE